MEENDSELAAVLLQGGADPNLSRSHYPYSPLRMAIRRESAGIVADLVSAGASVNTLGPDGQTALHQAAYEREGDGMTQLLLDAGGDLHVESWTGAARWNSPLRAVVRQRSPFSCNTGPQLIAGAGADSLRFIGRRISGTPWGLPPARSGRSTGG